jgi:hypothetical protein
VSAFAPLTIVCALAAVTANAASAAERRNFGEYVFIAD